MKFRLSYMIEKFFQKLKVLLGIRNSYRINYLNSNETLKPPLDKESEQFYIEMLSSNKNEAQKVLIEHNLRLVIYIAKKFEVSYSALEDLISIGTIGLVKAVQTFDPNKKIKLATYASKCIENEILMHLRKNNKLRNEISLDEPLNSDGEGNDLVLSDVLSCDDESVEGQIDRQENINILNQAISVLNEDELRLINYRFGLGGRKRKTQKEIADMMHISQSYISRLEKKVIGRLKKQICKLEK